jgi:hypothetical protein
MGLRAIGVQLLGRLAAFTLWAILAAIAALGGKPGPADRDDDDGHGCCG